MKQLTDYIRFTLLQLKEPVMTLSEIQYAQRSAVLSGASVGQHVRHVLELFTCLLEGYAHGTIHYENRKRDHRIETDRMLAAELLSKTADLIEQQDRQLTLAYSTGTDTLEYIPTSYQRELLYNLEHAIHHMALIRIGISAVAAIQLPDNFGVAPSTLQYRNACAQ